MRPTATRRPPTSTRADPDPLQHLLGCARRRRRRCFSDLGRVKQPEGKGRADRRGRMCREPGRRSDHRTRAPYVDIVFGPADPAPPAGSWLAQTRTPAAPAGRHQLSRDRKSSTTCRRATRGRCERVRLDHGRLLQVLQLLASCPIRAGEEVSRPVRRRARRGGGPDGTKASRRSRCWARTSNAYRGPMGHTRRGSPTFALLIETCCAGFRASNAFR